MKRIRAQDPESRSPDLVAANVAHLARLFPEAFTDGKVDFAVLRDLLGDAIDETEEKYGLNWHGKRHARRLALTPSTGTLRPCPEESVAWESTRNLMIEGDNLEVLKLLQKSYTNKVKLIYIDPPYNTGKDFVYRDNHRDGTRHYLRNHRTTRRQRRQALLEHRRLRPVPHELAEHDVPAAQGRAYASAHRRGNVRQYRRKRERKTAVDLRRDLRRGKFRLRIRLEKEVRRRRRRRLGRDRS